MKLDIEELKAGPFQSIIYMAITNPRRSSQKDPPLLKNGHQERRVGINTRALTAK